MPAQSKRSKKSKSAQPIVNRRARFDYFLGDELSVGMSLTGPEVRATRDNRVQLQGSFVRERRNELFLTGATFNVRTPKGETSTVVRDIKLLATKRQIRQLIEERSAGKTIVPTKLHNSARHIKLIIAIGKGKKAYDKRETIKARDLEREAKRGLK